MVSAHGQLVSPAEGEAVDHRDDRHRQVLQSGENGHVVRRQLLQRIGGLADEHADIGPGHEGPPAASNDERLDVVAGQTSGVRHLVDHRSQLAEQLLAERIEGVGAVEGHDGHPVEQAHVDEAAGAGIRGLGLPAPEACFVIGDRPARSVGLDEGHPFGFVIVPSSIFCWIEARLVEADDLEVLLFHDDVVLGQEPNHLPGLSVVVHVGAENVEIGVAPGQQRSRWPWRPPRRSPWPGRCCSGESTASDPRRRSRGSPSARTRPTPLDRWPGPSSGTRRCRPGSGCRRRAAVSGMSSLRENRSRSMMRSSPIPSPVRAAMPSASVDREAITASSARRSSAARANSSAQSSAPQIKPRRPGSSPISASIRSAEAQRNKTCFWRIHTHRASST